MPVLSRALVAALAAATTVSAAPADAAPTSTPIDDERCARNADVGTITYLTGYGYAAAASMVEVFVALERGYYDDLCLDVEVRPAFSTANYPLIADGEFEFASAGSFSELVSFALVNDADLVALSVGGRMPIEVLIAKPGTAETLEDFADTTIGVKRRLPSGVAAMLAGAGLVEQRDYTTVLVDGFDPLAHIAIDAIDAFPGYRSFEPGVLDRAGEDFNVFDPADYDVPGSFGVIYGNDEFVAAHPEVATDFVRATLRGLHDAVADPDAAVDIAIGLSTAAGNPNYLTEEGERFRWQTDSETLRSAVTDDAPLGVPVLELLQAELDAHAAVGIYPDGAPDAATFVATDPISSIYDDSGTLIWPG